MNHVNVIFNMGAYFRLIFKEYDPKKSTEIIYNGEKILMIMNRMKC